MNKEPDRMPVDCHFENEIRRRARFDRLPKNPIVVAVNQGLVQVEDKRLPLDKT